MVGRPRSVEVNDEDVIRLYGEIRSSKKIAERLGSSVSVVMKILKDNNIKIGSGGARRRLTDFEVAKVIELYMGGMSQKEIANRFDMSQQGIGKILDKEGVEIRRTKAWKGVNEHYFDVIDTEEKAYWLGFLASDGWISEMNVVGFALDIKDIDSVEKFASAIELNNKVKIDRTCACVKFKSVIMVGALKRLNFTTNKSIDFKPPVVKSHLERHFWRGVVDGDGSVLSTNMSGWRRDLVRLNGTKVVCEEFKKFAERVLGKKIGSLYDNKCNCFRVSAEGIGARELMCVLYGDAKDALSRKRDIAEGRMIDIDDEVRQIRDVDARKFLENEHYLKGLPKGCVNYGWFVDGVLAGVASIGSPAGIGTAESIFKDKKGVMELRRFSVSIHDKNNASRFLASVLRLAKSERLDWKAVISFADEDQGHFGIIYQATNAVYIGRTESVIVILPDGTRTSGRRAMERLTKVDVSKCTFTKGFKYKYVYFLNSERSDSIVKGLPYPKSQISPVETGGL